jgi:hypothetical protein
MRFYTESGVLSRPKVIFSGLGLFGAVSEFQGFRVSKLKKRRRFL